MGRHSGVLNHAAQEIIGDGGLISVLAKMSS